MADNREGNLEAPTRHPLGQDTIEFWDEGNLFAELERVFDICHGCRRCVSLCGSFPTPVSYTHLTLPTTPYV